MDSLTENNGAIKAVLKYFIVLIVCISDSFILLSLNKNEGYKYLFLLPLCYMVACLTIIPLIKKQQKHKPGYIYFLAQFVLGYRYVLGPLSCLYTDWYGGWTYYGTNGFGIEPRSASLQSATLWMCTEIFAAEFALLFGTMMTKKFELKKSLNNVNQQANFLKNKLVLVVFCLFSFALLFIFQRQLFSQFFILSEDYSTGSNAASGSFFKIIFLACKFGFILLGYSFCAEKYSVKHNRIWIAVALLFLFLYTGFSVGASRWSIILPAIASLYIFKEIFKPFSKVLFISIIIAGFISVMSISFYKFGYLLSGDENQYGKMLLLIFQQSNEYISGPRSVAQGLEMLSVYRNQISITTPFNSLFSGFVGLSSMTNDADKLQSFFNQYALGGILQDHPLICPIIIEGKGLFPVFPWIFIIIFEIMVCIFDYKVAHEKSYEMMFIYLYLGLWFALCFNGNTKTELSQISQMIPCFMLMYINKRLTLKNG